MPPVSRIEAHVVSGGWRDHVFVKVFDTEGTVGIGEATLKQKQRSVARAVIELGELVVGKDPADIERIWNSLFTQDHWRGGAVHNSALSGIETALWDLSGKQAGVPVWRFFGGRFFDEVHLYSNGWFRGVQNQSQVLEAARATVAEGFDAIKWNPLLVPARQDCLDSPTCGRRALVEAGDSVARVRAEVGPDVDLLIDCHGLLGKEDALLLCGELEKSAPLFVEEPVHPSNRRGLEWLCRRTGLRVACGERWFTRWDVLPILDASGFSILQTDVCHCGGLLELKKISSMAEAAHKLMAPHNSAGPVAAIATANVMVGCPNFLMLELFARDPAWVESYFQIDHRIERGKLRLVESPGLGISVNEKVLARRTLEVLSHKL